MDESVQIRCSKCRSKFRDRAHRVQSGYSRQCPSCEVVIFFEDGSPDKNVRQALNEAKRLRRAIQQEEVNKVVSHAPFVHRR